VRGEHRTFPLASTSRTGSSPRAWGACGDRGAVDGNIRFIPTCVGSIFSRDVARRPSSVHPHVRGEHEVDAVGRQHQPGSSPRAWGASGVRRLIGSVSRFIPTCVGSITGPARAAAGSSVHPHVRGEHAPTVRPRPCPPGSSPRAWGALPPASVRQRFRRFIPTCVGSIGHNPFIRHTPSVHPHVRGEHCGWAPAAQSSVGSSPRAWGALKDWNVDAEGDRFIPTCVGSICRRRS